MIVVSCYILLYIYSPTVSSAIDLLKSMNGLTSSDNPVPHHNYMDNNGLLDDIGQLIINQEWNPEQRLPNDEKIIGKQKKEKGVHYYQYKSE